MTQIWQEKTPLDIAINFKTDLSSGLTEAESQSRLKELGPNLLAKQKRSAPWMIFFYFLVSDKAKYITGQVIYVDGGYNIRA